jgi:hypothetical protein
MDIQETSATKKELNLETITAQYLHKNNPQYNYQNEFGFDSTRITIVRRYIWLNLKLTALYLAKCFNWIFHRT